MEQARIVEVTEFNPEHTVIICRLLSQLSSSPVDFTDTHLQEMLSSGNCCLFFLFYEEVVAGMLSVGSYRTPTGKKFWIEDVVVDEEYRGKRLGYALVEYAIGYVKKQGNASLMLTSNPARVAANKLYQSIGFEQKVTNVYKMKLGE